jgi:DNA replication protein DnaC
MTCSLCNGTGWKLVEQGARSAVARCDCWQETLIDRLLTEAQIPRRYQHCDLDRFVTYENESLENAVKQARFIAERFPVVSKGLFLLGRPGVGKTHLAAAVIKQVIRHKRAHALFYDTRQLLRVIRETYNPVVRATESDVLRPVMEAELLVLDDLGAEKTSEWVEETLNLIVNTRYSERRLSIFTSNYDISDDPTDPDSLQVRVGFRMYSRLHEMCEFLHMDGADYRELPLNGGVDDLQALWKLRKRPLTSRRTPPKAQGSGAAASSGQALSAAPASQGALPSRSVSQARARLTQQDPLELKWRGGKAGT